MLFGPFLDSWAPSISPFRAIIDELEVVQREQTCCGRRLEAKEQVNHTRLLN